MNASRGATGSAPGAARPNGRKRRRRLGPGWVPSQHGAWAMLLVPFLAGAIRSHGAWIHLPMLAFWIVGYFAFNAAALWVKSGFKARYRPPVLGYGAVAAAIGVGLAAWRPDLLWWAPVFGVCMAVSLVFSWRRRERALTNDVVTILAACLFGLVTYQAGYEPGGTILAGWRAMITITVVLFAYFVGTALYVKTMIRERGRVGWKVASVAYHGAVTAALTALVTVAAALPPGMHRRPLAVLAAIFALLTARAWALAGRSIRPLYIGLGEIAVCAALLAVIWVWG